MKNKYYCFLFLIFCTHVNAQLLPNITIIYADDLGYGDVSANGATKIQTPNTDKIAAMGLRFTNVYAFSATCTPSHFSMLTGMYAWRQSGTKIATCRNN